MMRGATGPMKSSTRKHGNPKGTASLSLPIALPPERVAKIAQQYGVQTLAVFGSVLRDDFSPTSDIDVLCTLKPDSPARGLGWIRLKLSLEDLWGRPVDLVKPQNLDPLIRDAVLREAQLIYVAP